MFNSFINNKKYNHDGSVIFLHVPKTAGTSLSHILQNIYSKKMCFQISGQHNERDIQLFKSLSSWQRGRLKVLMGHHSDAIAKLMTPPRYYICYLRDPISHTLSSFQYIRSTPHNRYYEQVVRLKSIDEFVFWQIDNGFDNLQLRYLAGIDVRLKRENREICLRDDGQRFFDIARSKLEKFEFVFTSEQFENSIKILSNALGWNQKYSYSVRLNSSIYTEDLQPKKEVIDLMEFTLKWDRKLHDFAKSKQERLKRDNSISL